MKSYIVIGLGKFGSQAARRLCQLNCEVLAMDTNAELVQHVANEVTQAVVADAKDKDVVKTLGAKDFECAIVAIGDDLSNSVLATMNLKELGVPYVVCKASDETHRQVLMKLGADKVVIPEQEHADRLARNLSSQNVLDYIELSEEYAIIEVPAPRSWQEKTLKELNVRAKLGVNIIAVKQEGKINVSPAADYRIKANDVMVVLGDTTALKAVQKL